MFLNCLQRTYLAYEFPHPNFLSITLFFSARQPRLRLQSLRCAPYCSRLRMTLPVLYSPYTLVVPTTSFILKSPWVVLNLWQSHICDDALNRGIDFFNETRSTVNGFKVVRVGFNDLTKSNATSRVQSMPFQTTECWENSGGRGHRTQPGCRCKTDTCWMLWTTKLSRFCAPCSTYRWVEMHNHSSGLQQKPTSLWVPDY